MKNGQHVGYIRVSSIDQNDDRQLANVSLDTVFKEKISSRAHKRPQLEACLKHLRAGDVFHVHSIDRLARNLKELQIIIDELLVRNVEIHFHKENLTFLNDSNPIQMLMLQMMGAFAEFERSLIRERQREGILEAKKNGRKLGRKPKLSNKDIAQLKVDVSNSSNKSSVAKKYGISRTKLYQLINEPE